MPKNKEYERQAQKASNHQRQNLDQFYAQNPQIKPAEENLVGRILRRRRTQDAQKSSVSPSLARQPQIRSWGAGQGQIPSWGEKEEAGKKKTKEGSHDQEIDQKPTVDSPREQKSAGRRMDKLRNLAGKLKGKGKGGGGSDAAQQAIKVTKRLQKIFRIVNGVSAASLWGIIITVVGMNFQGLFGNVVKVKWVPKLEKLEIALLVLLDIIIGVVMILALLEMSVFVAAAYYISHPIEALKLIYGEDGLLYFIIEAFKSLF